MRNQSKSAARQCGRVSPGPLRRSLRRQFPATAFAISLVFICGLVAAPDWAAAGQPDSQLPTITTARQAHSLSSTEAARQYPIHLRGVVTYFDPDYITGFTAVFMHDSSGGIFVRPSSRSIRPLPPGTVIDVTGFSGIGGFGPVVTLPQITVVGHSPLPPNPPRVSLSHLQTGAEDAQWVEVEGTVHSILELTRSVTLQLAMVDGTLSVTMPREAGQDYSNLVDAKVRVHGNAAPTINSNFQMIGVHLMAPNLTAVEIVEPAPGDPFQQPITPIDRLLHWDAYSASFHRMHLRGNVTLQWPGSSLCIRDATRGICVQTAQDTRFDLGDLVDTVGFAGTEDNVPVLTNAVLKSEGKGAPVAAIPVSVEQALKGIYDSDLIQVDGQLIGDDLSTPDLRLLLASGDTVFTAVLPKTMMDGTANPWKIGSRLRIIGICSVQVDARSNLREGVAVTKSFRILMRSPGDVIVLRGPSWWTPAHLLVILTLALIATLCVLCWVIVLRRRVEEQADLLRKSEEQFRHMALHDALTGLATRLLLDDRLNSALENAQRRKTCLALLMVDVDKFKQINDTYGHHGGDEVLRRTAERLVQAVRKSDTVARMGGDEFVVLLHDMENPAMAEGIAEKIVKSLAEPVELAGRQVPVSVSVGLSTSATVGFDEETLLKCADKALYHAKANGRNRYQVFTPELRSTEVDSIA